MAESTESSTSPSFKLLSTLLTPEENEATTKSSHITELKNTITKTSTTKLLQPKPSENNKNVLEVHLPTLISSFSPESWLKSKLKGQKTSSTNMKNNKNNLLENDDSVDLTNNIHSNQAGK